MDTARNFKSSVLLTAMAAGVLLFGYGVFAQQDEIVVPQVAYTSEDKRDPFEAYVKKEELPLSAQQLIAEENFVPPPLNITGVSWGSKYAQAIINSKVVKAGDIIDDVLVVGISKEALTFEYKKQQFTLPAPAMNKKVQP